MNLFDDLQLDLNNIVCHSGGAEGSDTYWETIGAKFGVKTKAYSYKTDYHKSSNKVEISEEDFKEGIREIKKANTHLNRYSIDKYINLLSRNWAQVKYSSQIFAIGQIVDPGKRGSKGYYSKSKYQSVDGGTGYCCQMAINNFKDVLIFDQNNLIWFRWSYITMSFIQLKEVPKITTQNFAGVGTRSIASDGIKAIEDVYLNTFNVLP